MKMAHTYLVDDDGIMTRSDGVEPLNSRMTRRIIQLESALARYGRHNGGCSYLLNGSPCDCGLAKALKRT